MLLARVSSSSAAGGSFRINRISPLRLVLPLFFSFIVSVAAIHHEKLEQTTAEGKGDEQDSFHERQQPTMIEQRFLLESILDASFTSTDNSTALPEHIQAAIQKRKQEAEWYSSGSKHQPPKGNKLKAPPRDPCNDGTTTRNRIRGFVLDQRHGAAGGGSTSSGSEQSCKSSASKKSSKKKSSRKKKKDSKRSKKGKKKAPNNKKKGHGWFIIQNKKYHHGGGKGGSKAKHGVLKGGTAGNVYLPPIRAPVVQPPTAPFTAADGSRTATPSNLPKMVSSLDPATVQPAGASPTESPAPSSNNEPSLSLQPSIVQDDDDRVSSRPTAMPVPSSMGSPLASSAPTVEDSIVSSSPSSTTNPAIVGSAVPSSLLQPTMNAGGGSEAPSTPVADGVVRASRFDLEYVVDGAAVTDEETTAATAVALDYLDSFLEQQFSFNRGTELTNFFVSVYSVDTFSVPVATLDVELRFGMDSIAIPNQGDVDNLLFTAFNIPFVPGLLTLLAEELPGSNPISSASSVLYRVARRRRRSKN